MATELMTYDETMSGQRVAGATLNLPATHTTLRDLIRARVYEETKAYNRRVQERADSLKQRAAIKVQAGQAELVLNAAQADHKSPVLIPVKFLDWQEQAERALLDFQRNRYFVLVGDRQIEELEDEIELLPGAEVTFLRLIPLAGG